MQILRASFFFFFFFKAFWDYWELYIALVGTSTDVVLERLPEPLYKATHSTTW